MVVSVAQLVEWLICTETAAGSNPVAHPTKSSATNLNLTLMAGSLAIFFEPTTYWGERQMCVNMYFITD